jgi:hypothetical protein
MKKLIVLLTLFIVVKAEAQTSLYSQDTLVNNSVFRQRVKAATEYAANQIAASNGDSIWKYRYANLVIANPDGGWLSAMTYQVVANPAISAESSDGDIQFTVNSNFDKVSKAQYGILPTQ